MLPPESDQKLDDRQQIIYSAMKNSETFKENKDENSNGLSMDWFLEIYGKIRYEQYMAGDTVFSHGDYGHKFYIIIQGAVSVLMPVAATNAFFPGTTLSDSICS